MFKKKCSKCEKKIEKSFDYCPHCGKNLKSKYEQEDFGMLGKDDFVNQEESLMNFGGSFIDKMFNKAMKMVEKQMRDLPKELRQNPNQNPQNKPYSNVKFRFLVNGKEVFPKAQNQKKSEIKPLKINNEISEEKAKQLAKLPRKEPKTKMKRLGEKLIYELSVPGVKDTKDIIINQLENSIEIKALSKNKVYSKIINVNLPIIDYALEKGNLIIELQAK